MVSNYKIRFAPIKNNPPLQSVNSTNSSSDLPQRSKKRQSLGKSRLGCPECKRRHVKCDETFPVCLRCQQRGSICMPVARMVQWQAELPWLATKNPQTSLASSASSININKRLMKCWFEKTCQIMVIDPDVNPLSFPIVEHLALSPSLVHALQSISAAHENFFDASSLATCLQERNHALKLIQDEIRTSRSKTLPSVFLSIFMLGLSSSWIEGNTSFFGVEHLLGARAVLDLIIQQRKITSDLTVDFTVGSYIYWDMATSFLVEPGLLRPINTTEISDIVKNMRHSFHPIAGYSIEIFYLLGTLGRYCREVLAGGLRDLLFELAMEEQMLQWQHSRDNYQLSLSSDAFRNHGLIMLYRICGSQIHVPLYGEHSPAGDDDHKAEEDDDDDDENESDIESAYVSDSTDKNRDIERIIRAYAVKTVDALSKVPITSPQLNLQSIPLLSAGSELTYRDTTQREEVIARFQALFSLNRIPANVHAVQLLRDLWESRDNGIVISWLELMLQKGWRLSFA